MDRTHWTHVTPRTVNECAGDVKPKTESVAGLETFNPRKAVCAQCGYRIRPMRRNEGPESLRAMFRF